MRGPAAAPEFSGGAFTMPQNDKAPALVQEYKYERLPDDQAIRMLTLEPGERDDPLKGKLEFFNVDSAGSYEPLSYVWGDENIHGEIVLHDSSGSGRLGLTASLHGALVRLRYRDRERRLWADQVCIQQKDKDERSQQVQFMNKIYKNASRVLVWLGPDDKGVAKSALELIHKLDETFQDEVKCEKFHTDYTKDLEKQSRDVWAPLDYLTDLPWFTRGWIVQEIGTEAPASLFWGETEIDWMTLHGVCEKLTDYHHLRSRFNIRTSDIKYVFQRFIEPDKTSYHANRFSFMYELHRARGLKLTDQCDRVFAMLGHYSVRASTKRLAEMKADYNKTLAQVYTDVAERSLTGASSLITLAAVQHMNLPPSEKAPKQANNQALAVVKDTLPSWVPDWTTYQSFILSEPINPHRAHGTKEPKLKIEGAILHIYGVKVDIIEACSKPLEAKEFHTKSSSGKTERAIETLWHQICGKGRFDLSEIYRNGDSAFFAYMQTLSNGCVQNATREGRSYHEIPKDEWLAEEAEYLVKTLGQSEVVAPELREMAEKRRAAQASDENWSRAANGASKNRIFARTVNGYYVLGPKVMEVGDVVCVLFGGKMPFCLRPWGPYYLLVGECYVHGLMNGEAIDMLKPEEVDGEVFDVV